MKDFIMNAKSTGSKICKHVKKNSWVYIILGVVGYIGYQISKVLTDKGIKDGVPYYKDFDSTKGGEEDESK